MAIVDWLKPEGKGEKLETNTKKVLAAQSKKLYEAINFDLDVCSEVGFLTCELKVSEGPVACPGLHTLQTLEAIWKDFGR